ncbi:MAG TPA: HEAT repeat domain-containing protein [Kiritimatiellia bacterium]|nr:HEAT repeat domain-containing protein [Kiritimatiellia bacterium]HPS06399.1 HEAT repeat domain-containing protein [Kiritimatiellia bacterium]
MSMQPSKGALRILMLALPAVLILGALLYFRNGMEQPAQEGAVPGTNAVSSAKKALPAARKAAGKKAPDITTGAADAAQTNGAAGRRDPKSNIEDVTKALDGALDADNASNILQEARLLLKHQNPEVRRRVVDALAWTGLDGFKELTTLMTDPDPDVAEAAREAWKQEYSMMESSELKSELLKQVGDMAVQGGDNELAGDVVEMITMDMDMSDLVKVETLQGYLGQTEDAECIGKILDAINEVALPDTPITKPDEVEDILSNLKKEEAASQLQVK